MYDIVIIGAGIIGTFIARELSRYKLNIALIDKENDVANGTTKANSAIVHAGFDAKPGSKMARFNVEGNAMFDKICNDLDVEFNRIGSLVIGFSEEEMKELQKLYQRGLENHVPDMEIIDKKRVKELEPNISDNVVGALYAATGGIVGPWEMAIALAENAIENGVELLLNHEVKDIQKTQKGYELLTSEGPMQAKCIINCAGVYADHINNMIAKPTFKINPRRGQYFVLDRDARNIVNTVVFQCPTKLGKGILVTPTVHGNILVGPDAEDLDDRENLSTTADRLEYIKEIAKLTMEKIPYHMTITTFAGLRAEPSTGDFIIEESKDAKGFINVAGIKSPGLTSSPAIAQYVVGLVGKILGNLEEKAEFNPTRRKLIRFDQLSQEEKEETIKRDSRFGRIICRCEHITEGEIVDIIKRKAGATTVDGVKRRARPGTGRCQGGFCGPRVVEILARELGKDMAEILKDGRNSNVLTEKTHKGSDGSDVKEWAAVSIEK
ncbi:NAD(P)/FAD-dependent oxidoreductase [Irregularibacter muris]|uniref:NAD(P)/FAD-dependent oxidoreductase n=1 Tax=Irregularibacter muris TaxID=1796619 RepID=A0AAE3HH09_9FIRM|nr:NAD(P)/FAD-dependent oxidoreductase [Irregularibacter muris]MCR1898948.1 NAD(P)/FAD-dependent oxidoreductase [Irregularibacter muris]